MLPCSHELDYKKDGKCDGGFQLTLLEDENKMNCDINNKDTKTNNPLCYTIVEVGKPITINWDYYKAFYNNKTRYDNDKDRLHCSHTSMISLTIYIYVSIKYPTVVKNTPIIKWIDDRIFL